MTNQERLNWMRRGIVKAEQLYGISANSKLNDHQPTHQCWIAKCNGIVVGQGASYDEAVRAGQKMLSEWDGSTVS